MCHNLFQKLLPIDCCNNYYFFFLTEKHILVPYNKRGKAKEETFVEVMTKKKSGK